MEEREVVDFRWRNSNAAALRCLFSAPFVSVAGGYLTTGQEQ